MVQPEIARCWMIPSGFLVDSLRALPDLPLLSTVYKGCKRRNLLVVNCRRQYLLSWHLLEEWSTIQLQPLSHLLIASRLETDKKKTNQLKSNDQLENFSIFFLMFLLDNFAKSIRIKQRNCKKEKIISAISVKLFPPAIQEK